MKKTTPCFGLWLGMLCLLAIIPGHSMLAGASFEAAPEEIREKIVSHMPDKKERDRIRWMSNLRVPAEDFVSASDSTQPIQLLTLNLNEIFRRSFPTGSPIKMEQLREFSGSQKSAVCAYLHETLEGYRRTKRLPSLALKITMNSLELADKLEQPVNLLKIQILVNTLLDYMCVALSELSTEDIDTFIDTEALCIANSAHTPHLQVSVPSCLINLPKMNKILTARTGRGPNLSPKSIERIIAIKPPKSLIIKAAIGNQGIASLGRSLAKKGYKCTLENGDLNCPAEGDYLGIFKGE